MKTKIIIQARVGSTRLPGKVLLRVMDKTILEYVIERVKRARKIDGIIVATTIKEEDRAIANLTNQLGADVFCGSENDVLDRYYQAAKRFGAGHIVRITADCPLIDPDIIDEGIKCYFDSGADYCSNVLERTYPDGEDVEVLGFGALSKAWRNAELMSEREHVTTYIRKHPERFKLVNFRYKTDISAKRWTLDRKEDFDFIKAVLETLYPHDLDFHMKDVLEFLKINPHIEKLNEHITPAEGYLKSLREDKVIRKH